MLCLTHKLEWHPLQCFVVNFVISRNRVHQCCLHIYVSMGVRMHWELGVLHIFAACGIVVELDSSEPSFRELSRVLCSEQATPAHLHLPPPPKDYCTFLLHFFFAQ